MTDASGSELHRIEPGRPATASVIWLHGLGADGSDFVPAVPMLGLPAEPAVRFLFPTAPVRPVTVNGGWPMPAWYDILEMNIERRIDEASIDVSAGRIRSLIDSEVDRGIAPERIFLFGFSQGGALAYHTALRYPQRLGGLVALSTYLATEQRIRAEISTANARLPLLICHGDFDDVVPQALGRRAHQTLSGMGLEPQWRQYPIAHEVSAAELRDVGAWLMTQLSEERNATE